jgi:predicted nucleic acid-binding protein
MRSTAFSVHTPGHPSRAALSAQAPPCARQIDARYERGAMAAFADDVTRGYLQIEPLSGRHAIAAADLLQILSNHSLRTLDASHPAVAQSAAVPVLATADRAMARAAEALGITAVTFG